MTSVLYVFAHHDDEASALPLLVNYAREGARQRIIFTTACGPPPLARKRHAETRAFLDAFGLDGVSFRPLGHERGYETYRLHHFAEAALKDLAADVANDPPDVCVSHAWEGGHADHDVSLLLCAAALQRTSLRAEILQTPLYHGAGMPAPLFLAAAPLRANGHRRRAQLPRADWARFLFAFRHYPSQWRVMIGLWPMLLLSLAVQRGFGFQRLGTERLFERPHAGPLMYERRKEPRYDDIARLARAMLNPP